MPVAFSRKQIARVVLAGPLAFLCAFVVVCAASVWLPPGPALIDNIAVPLVLFPAVWAMLFFYCYLTINLWRAYALLLILVLAHAGLIVWQISRHSGAGVAG